MLSVGTETLLVSRFCRSLQVVSPAALESLLVSCAPVSLLLFLPVLVFSCPSGTRLTAFPLPLPLHSPLPGCLPFLGAPNRAASAWHPTPQPLQRSQQRPAPIAAASLAQGPALTVTHRADGGDFDEEATPPPVGTRMCVCVYLLVCITLMPGLLLTPSPLPAGTRKELEGADHPGSLLPSCHLPSVPSVCLSASQALGPLPCAGLQVRPEVESLAGCEEKSEWWRW